MTIGIPAQKIFLMLGITFISMQSICAQVASPVAPTTPIPTQTDTLKKKRSVASTAALYSTILPGLGQAYNKKYWKIPIVYGVIAIPVSLFRYNSNWYKKTREAFTIRSTNDTANFNKIDPQLVPLSNESLRLYRNEFRKNMDFSVLGILVAWGLNIVDATVDGHLRGFDISDEVTLKLDPHFSAPTGQWGLKAAFQLNFSNKHKMHIGR